MKVSTLSHSHNESRTVYVHVTSCLLGVQELRELWEERKVQRVIVFQPCGSERTRSTQSLSRDPAQCVATFTEPLSALRDDPPGTQGLRAPRWLPAPTPTSHQSRPAHLRVQGIPSPRPTRRSFCAHPRTRRALAVVHPETRSLASGTHAVTRPPRRGAQNLSIQPVRPDVMGVKQPI